MWPLLDSSVHECIARKALAHDAPVLFACLSATYLSLSKDKDLSGLVSEATVESFVLLTADTSSVPSCYGER